MLSGAIGNKPTDCDHNCNKKECIFAVIYIKIGHTKIFCDLYLCPFQQNMLHNKRIALCLINSLSPSRYFKFCMRCICKEKWPRRYYPAILGICKGTILIDRYGGERKSLKIMCIQVYGFFGWSKVMNLKSSKSSWPVKFNPLALSCFLSLL